MRPANFSSQDQRSGIFKITTQKSRMWKKSWLHWPWNLSSQLDLRKQMTALEHLRKLIEASTDKIKVAKVKEEQARKVLRLHGSRGYGVWMELRALMLVYRRCRARLAGSVSSLNVTLNVRGCKFSSTLLSLCPYCRILDDPNGQVYWLNILQNLGSTGKPYLVTLNPPGEPRDVVNVWRNSHPLLQELPKLPRSLKPFRASEAYGSIEPIQGYSFHEDRLKIRQLLEREDGHVIARCRNPESACNLSSLKYQIDSVTIRCDGGDYN